MHTEKLVLLAEKMALGEYPQTAELENPRLTAAVNKIINRHKEIVNQTMLIAQGIYDVPFNPVSDKDELGQALLDMKMILYEMSLENKKTAWMKTGQAELSSIVQSDQDVQQLGQNVISFLTKYINCLVSTIYKMSDKETLELIGSFAYDGDRQVIKLGEGLVGECALEKDVLSFFDVPVEYMCIQSASGQAPVKHIVLIPLLLKNEVFGVMEFGSHELFDPTKIEFLKQVSETIALGIKSCKKAR